MKAIATDTPLSSKAYDAAYARELVNEYPVVDAFEQRMGHALERNRLERAARVLACPLKAHPPNWQHGRVLYALARNYCRHQIDVSILDIGTAKGFSALCLLWAMRDADILGTVTSVDVLDPLARVRRNTVAEVEGYKTLAETLEPWPEAQTIRFKQRKGLEELCDGRSRIHVCFIDGKHDADVVRSEGYMLAQRQMVGDVAVFDDVHIDGVWLAVNDLKKQYEIERLDVIKGKRAYAIGVRRG